MAFIDVCKLYIKAGDGGNGALAWRREAHVPMGGPAGGNGGNGGNIYFVADENETSLAHLVYKKHIYAPNGEDGSIKNMHGKNADNIFIKVPIGTIIINNKTNEALCDFLYHNQKHLIAKGGQGGHGNAYFKSSFNKAPSLYENGDLGEELELRLELKEIADVGIIGFPNAGKSSLISKLTNAKPKIANYMFTTLVPILGTIDYNQKKIIICDIPGIIENASSGSGLGLEFLKHIERCKILIHLISLSSSDNEDPINSYLTINNELKKYNVSLLNKKIIVVLNKIDTLDAENKKIMFEKFINQKVLAISCTNNINLDILKKLIIDKYDELCKQEVMVDEIINFENQEQKLELDKTLYINKINDHLWDVKSDYLKYWTHKIPLTTQDNIIRYNQKISNLNLEEQLIKMGAELNDTIIIYGVEVTLDGKNWTNTTKN